jgi:hypothetical protein
VTFRFCAQKRQLTPKIRFENPKIFRFISEKALDVELEKLSCDNSQQHAEAAACEQPAELDMTHKQESTRSMECEVSEPA